MAVELSAEQEHEHVSAAPMAAGRVLTAGFWVLAAVPFLLAVAEAIRAPRLNFGDYWLLIGKTTTETGAIRPSALFDLHNDHPAVLVDLVFWLDAKVFAGHNNPLGLFSVGLALLMFVALVLVLPRTLTGIARLAVIVAMSALVFSSAATEYWGIGMSGAHWLLGLAPSVVALAAAHRGHTVLPAVLGLIACFGHGAGFPVWAGLLFIAWLRREKAWRLVLPVVLGACVLVTWVLASEGRSYPAPFILGADTYLSTILTTLGQVLSPTSVDFALAAGTAIAALLIIFTGLAVRDRLRGDDLEVRDVAAFVGLGVYALLAAVLIGLGRGHMGPGEGLAPRYAGIALLAVVAVVVLAAARKPAPTPVVAGALAVAVATFAIGSNWATATRNKYPTQPVLAVAMHVGANDTVLRMFAYPKFIPVLRQLRVYPFTDDFTLGCRGPELGSSIDLGKVPDLPAPSPDTKTAGAVETGEVVGDTEILGWAMVDGAQPDCVLVVDGGGKVVGGGAVGLPRRDVLLVVNATGRAGWRAVAAPGTQGASVLISSHGQLYKIKTILGR